MTYATPRTPPAQTRAEREEAEVTCWIAGLEIESLSVHLTAHTAQRAFVIYIYIYINAPEGCPHEKWMRDKRAHEHANAYALFRFFLLLACLTSFMPCA